MSEKEVKPEKNETQVENKEAPPEYTEIELEAMRHGWKPKEEFDTEEKNQGKKWRSAEEFMDRKSLYDKIEETKNEARQTRKALMTLAAHNARLEKAAYEKALKELKEQRQQALKDEDLVLAEELRDQIDEVKEKMNLPTVPVLPQEDLTREFEQWRKENLWYGTDEDLTLFADGIGNALAAKGMPPGEVMKEVSRRVRNQFADKFRNPNRDTAPKLEAGNKPIKRTSKDDTLSPEEERMINTLLKAGAPITREEYIKQLKTIKGV